MFFPNHDTNQYDVNASSKTGSVDFQAESSISQTKTRVVNKLLR